MKKTYGGLYEMLETDTQAQSYFSSLPDYVKEHMESRQQNVNSLDSLMDYAENLLRGDG